MQLKQIFTLSTSLSTLLLLSACGGGGTDYKFPDPTFTTEPSPTAVFSPADGGPTTNNLLFAGSTDGTLNIPNDAANPNPIITALNTLDGFSTTNPIATTFGTPLDAASLVVGDSIHVFEVTTTAAGVVTGVVAELAPNEITAVATGTENKTLALLPLRPLKESTTYMVVLTNGIKDAEGLSAKSSSTYLLLKSALEIPDSATSNPAQLAQLRALRPMVNAMESAVATPPEGVDAVAPNSIVLSWAFTTQSITPTLDAVAENATAGTLTVAPTGATPKTFIPTSAGISDVYIGTLDAPYFLKEPSATDPLAGLTSYWKGVGGSNLTRFNPTAVATGTMTMPVMLTIPKETDDNPKPDAGWPIVMYQHGITRVRTDMLIYADNLAKAGFALVAIDLPMHGITDPSSPFMADNTPFPNDREQTFNMDFVNNTTGAAGPDGNIDDSGRHFINLSSLLTSRDNMRQGVSNLLTLRRSLGNIPNINADKVGFIAHSLGGVVGATYLGVETIPTPSSLMTMGGGISAIVENSGSFGPPVIAGLAAQGVTGDSLRRFFIAAQAILDPADPLNFASSISSVHPIHMIEVVGDGTDENLPDQTIPNLVRPLGGTEPLAALMGLKSVSGTVNDIAPTAGGIVRFTQGEHASILRPSKDGGANTTYLKVFIEMHRQVTAFQASGGTTIAISNSNIIKQ
ncbi:MAG TPA: lipase [Leucothrix mucor]|nr:lipase [Leucothrix mucor]